MPSVKEYLASLRVKSAELLEEMSIGVDEKVLGLEFQTAEPADYMRTYYVGFPDDFSLRMTREHYFMRHEPCGKVIKTRADENRQFLVAVLQNHLEICPAKTAE
jgi:hypothetical protein